MKKRDLVAAAVGALAATALAGGVAWATIPAADGTINGCYQKSNGQLRVIDTAVESCRASELVLHWSQQGVKGDKGDPGPPGQDGQDGAPGLPGADGKDGVDGRDGAPGVSGYEIVTANKLFAPHEAGYLQVNCPAGKVPIQGSATDFNYRDLVIDQLYDLSPGGYYKIYYANEHAPIGDPNPLTQRIYIQVACITA